MELKCLAFCYNLCNSELTFDLLNPIILFLNTSLLRSKKEKKVIHFKQCLYLGYIFWRVRKKIFLKDIGRESSFLSCSLPFNSKCCSELLSIEVVIDQIMIMHAIATNTGSRNIVEGCL